MSAVAVPPSRARIKQLHEGLVNLAYRNTLRQAEKYARQCPSPNTGPEDLAQVVWMKLLEWLQDPAHQDQAEGLLEAPDQAVRFMQTFAKCRICDQLDYWFGGLRDARKTLHASQCPSSPQADNSPSDAPNIENIASPAQSGNRLRERTTRGSEGSCIADIQAICQTRLAGQILEILAAPPLALRETFWESRLKLSTGQCRLFWPGTRANAGERSRIDLYAEDGERTWRRIYLDGSPNKGTYMHKQFSTDAGTAHASWCAPEDYSGSWAARNMGISWSWGLRVNLAISGRLVGRKSVRGMYTCESVSASSSALNEKIMADHLGVSRLAVREAWRDLRAALAVL